MEPKDLLADIRSMDSRGVEDDVKLVLITKYTNGYCTRAYNQALEDTKAIVCKMLDDMRRI